MRTLSRKHEQDVAVVQWVLPGEEENGTHPEAVTVTVDLLEIPSSTGIDARYVATLRNGPEVYFKSEAFFTETAALKRLESLLIEGGWQRAVIAPHYSFWQLCLKRLGMGNKFVPNSIARAA